MADGRANNGGHSTAGKAGRRSKAEELRLLETIDKSCSQEDEKAIWDKIIKEAKAGSRDHIRIFLERKYGKPDVHKTIDMAVEEIILKRL